MKEPTRRIRFLTHEEAQRLLVEPPDHLAEMAALALPYHRDVLSALTHFTAQSGNRELALKYVKELCELDPEDTEYVQMAKQIEGHAR